MVSNFTLRQNARSQLGDNIFKTKWMMMLVVCAILPFVEGMLTATIVGVILSIVLHGPLLYGMARTQIECVENQKWDILHVFCGFSEDFGQSVLLGFLRELFIALWSLLLVVPGIVKSYSYAMAFYIRQEKGGVKTEAIDCITQSRKMMDGHKWQLFCLDLSFIGWYVVGALCFGFGVLFVMPYHEVARANFYEALKAKYATPVTEREESENYV